MPKHYSQLRLILPYSGCNLKCKYCLDHLYNRTPNTEFVFDKDKILETIGNDTFDKISIWGGEPLYNFEWFKSLVLFCKEYFPNIPISTLCNGYLITDEVVEFVNDNAVSISISHDGVAQSYRGKDFLTQDYIENKLKKLNHFTMFNAVAHNYNCDYEANFNYFQNIIDTYDIQFGLSFEFFKLNESFLFHYTPRGSSLALLDKSYKFYLHMYDIGHPLAANLKNQLFGYARTISNNIENDHPLCGALKRLSVRTDGVKFHCQVEAENEDYYINKFKMPSECQLCQYKNLCGGICPFLSNPHRQKLCIVYKLWYKNVINYFNCVNNDKEFI